MVLLPSAVFSPLVMLRSVPSSSVTLGEATRALVAMKFLSLVTAARTGLRVTLPLALAVELKSPTYSLLCSVLLMITTCPDAFPIVLVIVTVVVDRTLRIGTPAGSVSFRNVVTIVWTLENEFGFALITHLLTLDGDKPCVVSVPTTVGN